MTADFDEALEQSLALSSAEPDESYLASMRSVEEPLVRAVLLNAGDREFPDDLRQRILTVVAMRGIFSPSGITPMEEARKFTLAMRYSRLVVDLHTIFHGLAARRLETRFGLWTDSPHGNIVSRDRHDAAAFDAEPVAPSAQSEGGDDAEKEPPAR